MYWTVDRTFCACRLVGVIQCDGDGIHQFFCGAHEALRKEEKDRTHGISSECGL